MMIALSLKRESARTKETVELYNIPSLASTDNKRNAQNKQGTIPAQVAREPAQSVFGLKCSLWATMHFLGQTSMQYPQMMQA